MDFKRKRINRIETTPVRRTPVEGFMKITVFLIFGITEMFLFGCANPSIHTYKKEYFQQASPRKVLVPRFEGDPNFIEESTDLFIAQLEKRSRVDIAQAGVLRPNGLNDDNLASSEIALRVAKQNNADLLVMGKVTSHQTAGTMNGFSTIRVYDVSTGEKVATFHRPSGLITGWSVHQCVMAAVKRTATDLGKLIVSNPQGVSVISSATDYKAEDFPITSYQFDAKTRRGSVVVDIGDKGFQARLWVIKNIGMVCSSKNIAMEAGRESFSGAKYTVLDESFQSGLLKIDFEATY